MRRREFIVLAAGAASLASPALGAQQKDHPVVGVLSVFSQSESEERLAAFRRALSDSGYAEGRNLAIEYRWAEHQYDRLPGFAADLVARKVDVIAAFGPPAAHAAKEATSSIAIVFGVGTDPVKDGLVARLAYPGGNVTGISFLVGDLEPKRIELLSK